MTGPESVVLPLHHIPRCFVQEISVSCLRLQRYYKKWELQSFWLTFLRIPHIFLFSDAVMLVLGTLIVGKKEESRGTFIPRLCF